ncbi:hypothetical protein ES704_03005 [subsurface metagenome]|jgi:hypothetical protein
MGWIKKVHESNDQILKNFMCETVLKVQNLNMIFELEHEEGYYYATPQDVLFFYKSAKRKFGNFINYKLDKNKETQKWFKSFMQIPYVYKPTAKRVIRYNKRKDLKSRLKNNKELYYQASRNSYKNFRSLYLAQKDALFLLNEFGSIRKFHRYCRNIDSYIIPQRKITEFIGEN